MVSPALVQLLERARVRFGLEIEILDAALNNLYPEGGTELSRIIKESPAVRRSLLQSISGGRPESLDGVDAHYRVYPLRQSSRRRHAAGLLAIRRSGSDVARALDAEPWSDLARAIVETDLAAVDSLGVEQQRSRRLVGSLRFIEHITETKDEASLAQALVQAAAVWYDVDARIYRRSLAGTFVLHTWLPGVQPHSSSLVLNSSVIGADQGIRRLSAGDLGESGAGHEALVVPLSAGGTADWVMALVGTVPSDADLVLRSVARAAGTQLVRFVERRAGEARRQFEALLADTTKAPELVAVRVVLNLAQALKASSGSLALTRSGRTRRIAAIGQAGADAAVPVAAQDMFAEDRLVCALSLGPADYAVLELRAGHGQEFTPDAAVLMQACASAIRIWLAGTLGPLEASAALLEGSARHIPAFEARIQEELEHARRFDLRLSLILVDVHAPSDAIGQLQEALRQELRGSDVTGAMGAQQVAALLTHTDAIGLDNVVRRLKQRLADAAARLNLSDLRLGQAAFSPDVRTADALLELALRQAEPVALH